MENKKQMALRVRVREQILATPAEILLRGLFYAGTDQGPVGDALPPSSRDHSIILLRRGVSSK